VLHDAKKHDWENQQLKLFYRHLSIPENLKDQNLVASPHSVLIGGCAVNSTDTVLFRLQQQPKSQDSIGADYRNRVQCITPGMAVNRET